MNQLLQGVRVLDLSRVMAGPWSGQILADLGANQLRLMTNNPAKYGGIEGYGLEIIERVAINPVTTKENLKYLQTKRDRMGHLFSLPESDSEKEKS